MTFEITAPPVGMKVCLSPRVELYRVEDFAGREMPGLAIVLDKVGSTPAETEQYAVLTVSFGQFISLKNSAYIDINNCPWARQLLELGIARETQFTKRSGYCEYPLWIFSEKFLIENGGANYQKYLAAFEAQKKPMDFPEDLADIPL